MIISQPVSSGPGKVILPQGPTRHSVVLPEDAPPSQLRNQQGDDIPERLWNASVAQIEPIHIRNLDPPFQLIRHRRRAAHQLGAIPAQDEPLRDSLLVPRHPIRRRRRPMVHHAPHSGRRPVAEPEILLVGILAEIEARPPPKQSQRALSIPVRRELLVLLPRRLVALSDDDQQARDDLDVLRIPSQPGRFLPDALDGGTHQFRGMPVQEDGLCVRGSEVAARRRRARLEEERRALGRGLAEMRARHREVFPLVVDLPHSFGVGVCAVAAPWVFPSGW